MVAFFPNQVTYNIIFMVIVKHTYHRNKFKRNFNLAICSQFAKIAKLSGVNTWSKVYLSLFMI